MSKEIKNKMMPKLRFPKFEQNGDWVEATLGSAARFINGRAYKQEEMLDKGKYRLLRVGNFFTNNRWYYSDLELESDKYCEDGDLLYAWSASFGPRVWHGEKTIYHYHIWKVEPNETINSKFLYILLDYETERMKSQSANGFALLHITKGTIEGWKCYFPVNKEEQLKIADCLSSLDDLITAESQKLEAFKTHKKGLMQQLFPAEGETVPKLRFKEFRDSGDWEKKEFNDILEITRLAGYEYSEYWKEDPNQEIIALRGYNIGKGNLELNNLAYISNKLSMRLIRSRLAKGDIVYPCVGTIGNAVVIEEDDKYHIQQNIAKITPNKGISPYFISQFLMSDLGLKEVNRFNATSSQPNVLVGSLRKFEIHIPGIEEQKEVSNCLSSLDELITAQTEKTERLKIHKKGLMQQLFPNVNDFSS